MGTLAVAVIGTAATIKSQRDQKKAQQNAAREQARANIESANQLARAGRLAEADILRANAEAAETAAMAAIEAEQPLLPFAESMSFQRAQDEILSGLPIDDAISSSIRQASTDFVRSRPEFNLSGPVGEAIETEADIIASGAQPSFTSGRLGMGQQGLAALADVAQVRQRGFQRLGDIVGSQASQRANVLTGQTAGLADLATGASEARLLGDVAAQQYRTGVGEQLANLGGQLYSLNRNRTDEFGFKKGEDPFAAF